MAKEFSHSIFIGRFSPFHLGHLSIIKQGLEISDNVLVVIGSSSKARDTKNPWTTKEREQMILNSLKPEEAVRVDVISARDYLYNDNLWIADIQNKISQKIGDAEKIALIGYESDRSSFYLKLFPQWKFISCATEYEFHATEIRNLFFTDTNKYTSMIPEGTAGVMISLKSSMDNLFKEYKFIQDYKKKWSVAPFPPTFITTDAIVLCSGHVLLVRRNGPMGKNLLAIPGGFLGQDETLQAGAIRELKEETNIKLSKEELIKNIKEMKMFDHPNRSERGRTITAGFFIDLGFGPLPQVKGGDDASHAYWMALREIQLNEDKFFEDHFHIINYFVTR